MANISTKQYGLSQDELSRLKQTAASAVGRELTPTETNQIYSSYQNFAQNASGEAANYPLRTFMNAVTSNPSAYSSEIAKNLSKEYVKEAQTEQAATRAATRPQLAAEYAPLEQAQIAQLTNQLGEARTQGTDLLSRTLAARGLGRGGSLQAGIGDISDKYMKALTAGTLGIQSGSQAAQLSELGNISAGNAALTNTERQAMLGNAATTQAQQFQSSLQDKYIQQMADIASKNQPDFWSYLMQGIGTAASIVPSLVSGGTTNAMMAELMKQLGGNTGKNQFSIGG